MIKNTNVLKTLIEDNNSENISIKNKVKDEIIDSNLYKLQYEDGLSS